MPCELVEPFVLQDFKRLASATRIDPRREPFEFVGDKEHPAGVRRVDIVFLQEAVVLLFGLKQVQRHPLDLFVPQPAETLVVLFKKRIHVPAKRHGLSLRQVCKDAVVLAAVDGQCRRGLEAKDILGLRCRGLARQKDAKKQEQDYTKTHTSDLSVHKKPRLITGVKQAWL